MSMLLAQVYELIMLMAQVRILNTPVLHQHATIHHLHQHRPTKWCLNMELQLQSLALTLVHTCLDTLALMLVCTCSHALTLMLVYTQEHTSHHKPLLLGISHILRDIDENQV